ncbi:MAG: hypothetical protein Q4E47_00370 [Candidatus Saccharibacteria bacterium]|nr:hypothetical protein [Candidatus Saccharibacteria bacterium]
MPKNINVKQKFCRENSMSLSSHGTNKSLALVASSFAVFSASFVAALVFSGAALPEVSSYAETETNVLPASEYYLSLSSKSDVSIDVLKTTAEGAIATAEDTLTVKTNTSGYKVALSAVDEKPESQNLYLDGDTEKESIKATSGTAEAPKPLDQNSWGYAVAGLDKFDEVYDSKEVDLKKAKFAALPKFGEGEIVASNSWEKSGIAHEAEHTVVYGVHANSLLSAGKYEGVILYTISSDTLMDPENVKVSVDSIDWAEEGTFPLTVDVLTMSNMNEYAWSVKLVNAKDDKDIYECANVEVEQTNNEEGDTPGVKITCDAPKALGKGKKDAEFKVIAVSEKLGEYEATDKLKVKGTEVEQPEVESPVEEVEDNDIETDIKDKEPKSEDINITEDTTTSQE